MKFFVTILFLFLFPFADTGNVMCTLGSNVDRAGSTAWTNVFQLVGDDGADATCNATGSDYLVGSFFGISLPDGAIVDGMEAAWEISEHSPGSETVFCQLQGADGNLVGTSKSVAVSGTAKTIYTYGGPTDKWGTTLGETDIEDSDFGARLWFETSHDVRVDWMYVKIYYHVSGTRRIFNSLKK